MKEIYIGKKVFPYENNEQLFGSIAFDKFFKDRDLFKDLVATPNEEHVKVNFGPLITFRFKSAPTVYKLWGKVINTLKDRYKDETSEGLTIHPEKNNVYDAFDFIRRVNNFFDEELNHLQQTFDLTEEEKISTDGRDESKLQENPIKEYLISKNEEARRYGIRFEDKETDNNRSTEDIFITDITNSIQHWANIKSKQPTSVTNIGKSAIIGYVLSGVKKVHKNSDVTDMILKKNLDMDRKLNNDFYFYIVFNKKENAFSFYELTYIDETDITVNPSNCLQSKFVKPCTNRTDEQRYEFIYDLWKTYRDKQLEGFDGME